MKKHRKFTLSTTQVIMLSFLIVILIGSILLSLPISSRSGESVSFIDALFTATTSTCVTGLVTVTTYSTWSIFGQIVILILIQIGGLGVITIMSGVMIALHKRMKFSDRLLIQDAFNIDTLEGLVRFIKKVILGTFLIEGIGALFYMTVFVPEYGLRGIWISVFTSVSAFCNAGIDIISDVSLCEYATNPIINFVTALLIILGGLGYIVWWDLLRVFKKFKQQRFKCLRLLTLHSKIVLSVTSALIVVGAVFIFVFEYGNSSTIGEMNLFDKIQVSFFQSVTTRTAGFASIPQENLTTSSSIICMLLMFIGGSPVGTAGGVKTVTIAVIIASGISTVKNRNETVLFNRSVSRQAVNKAITVVIMSFTILVMSTILLSMTTDAGLLDILYETTSATATVGLTRSLTPLLDIWGKLVIIATMYLGRVGPISLAIAFNVRKESQNIVRNPTEKISVG